MNQPEKTALLSTQDVDKRSAALMEELDDYSTQCMIDNPGADPRLIYESWMIQKIASLQEVGLAQNKVINRLQEYLRNNKR